MARRGTSTMIVSFIVAFVLSIVVLPTWLESFRPLWVLLVVIYWALYLDNSVGVITAWLLGLLQDLLNSSLLGEHAIGMMLVAFLVLQMQRQLRMFPMWQQMVAVFIFSMLYLGLIFCAQALIGQLPHYGMFWIPAAVTALIWPWVAAMLHTRQQRFEAL
ncbi:MAG: rod shape-determining protein MreD [Gammaproteobacteria bacterium]|nr:rod shape-determining protein MreD [Gammaproteobacteria bacterium]